MAKGGNSDDEFLKKLGARIKSIRESKGYGSYETFAHDKNIHRAQFGRYEKGENLQILSLVKVVKLLDMDLKEFFSEGFD